jgi:hypothetical protein
MKLFSMVKDWYCPQCGKTDRTNNPKPHTRYHICPKLKGMSAPMVEQGVDAKLVLVERGDYEGEDTGRTQLTPEGKRPVMALRTERADGSNDVIVYAPTASGTGRA